jgi:3-oxoacyl-[acyl-carrier protein] reductase
MNLDLSGKKALVCGSTQGIGLAAAEQLASLGCEIVLCARNEGKLIKESARISSEFGVSTSYLVADFSYPDKLKEALDNFLPTAGNIHILVNNTGGPDPGPAHSASIDAFRIAFNSHLICNHILVQALLPGMKTAGYGRIINVISTSVKQPLPNLGVSNTIRGAVANWSKTLANELGPFGITVNNVLPGATETSRLTQILDEKSAKTGAEVEKLAADMVKPIPAGRFGKPEEIGSAIAFLSTPAAAYINGVNLPVDGGRTSSL